MVTLTHDRNFRNDLPPFQVVRGSVLALHERLEEVIELLPREIPLESFLGLVQHNAVVCLPEAPHAAVGRQQLRDLHKPRIELIRPDEMRLGCQQ